MARHDIKEARKDNLIDAALRVFAEKGYSDTTMTDIARKAGVSTPVLYEYFNQRRFAFCHSGKNIQSDIRRIIKDSSLH